MYINPNTLSNQSNPAPGLLELTDEQAAVYTQYNGFIRITSTDPVEIEPDMEAYQEWCAENPAPDPLESARAVKETELSSACNAAIVAGMDVPTTHGTEHFSLQETDQINLTTAYNAVMSGAEQYPYHADGKLCRMFTEDEIKSISAASIQHKMYHTTLCNHLLTWARRAETAEELAGITYSSDNLPADLAQNMTQIMASSQNV